MKLLAKFLKPIKSHALIVFCFVSIFSVLLGEVSWAEPCDPRPILKPVEGIVFLSDVVTYKVLARVDTGATISSLDADLAHQWGLDREIVREALVRNAHGVSKRPVVKLRYLLQGKVYEAEFTLVSRADMPHAVLLGRQSLRGFLVDPGLE